MIPKIIHYCWFGGAPLPQLAKECIESWKKYCPGYEIKEWNEGNFDLTCCTYVKEAYEAKKWAFVTDYVRLKALVDEGGIYMDTDVEVIRPLDEFLSEKAFLGFEKENSIHTGIMASEKRFLVFEELLENYTTRHFLMEDGSCDQTTNCTVITQICLKHGLQLNNKKQIIAGLVVYPKDYFCPKSYLTGEILCTSNTFTIHHFSGSWHTKEEHNLHKKEMLFFKKCNSVFEVLRLKREWQNTVLNTAVLKGVKSVYIYGFKNCAKRFHNKKSNKNNI